MLILSKKHVIALASQKYNLSLVKNSNYISFFTSKVALSPYGGSKGKGDDPLHLALCPLAGKDRRSTKKTKPQILMAIPESTPFFNFTFDKGRLKTLVSWTLQNYGHYKTVELLEQLKKTGFEYATKAGISLGIDDLKIPPKKRTLLLEAEQLTRLTINQFERADITAVERFQRLVDTWHRTSEQIKQEVINHFEETDILNPVYMMAFSGARGNISQVRQLVGMRGLMSDPQGQIIDFPIQSNFREGLTLTEYIISSYGARKGIVDTALRTANAGYLTRRLVDVAQHVMISHYDCGTNKGIFLTDMKEGNKTIVSAQTRILGRVLARDIYKPNTTIKIAHRNQEITNDLAFEITKVTNKIFVRSALTCNTTKLLCQLCYGWSLAQGNLVSVGEAVGVIAAQSIGEPGTQLTMRTFHTGGVFSGDISDEIRAPYNGTVSYDHSIPGILIRTLDGKVLFLTKSDGTLIFTAQQTDELSVSENPVNVKKAFIKKYKIPAYTILFVRNGEPVESKQVIAQITAITSNASDTAELVIKSDFEGLFYGKTLQIEKFLIGPSPKFVGELKQDVLIDPKAMEIVVKARGWNFAWVLSGKRYETPLLLNSFPMLGDYITSQTVITKHNLNLGNVLTRFNKINIFKGSATQIKHRRLSVTKFAQKELTAKSSSQLANSRRPPKGVRRESPNTNLTSFNSTDLNKLSILKKDILFKYFPLSTKLKQASLLATFKRDTKLKYSKTNQSSFLFSKEDKRNAAKQVLNKNTFGLSSFGRDSLSFPFGRRHLVSLDPPSGGRVYPLPGNEIKRESVQAAEQLIYPLAFPPLGGRMDPLDGRESVDQKTTFNSLRNKSSMITPIFQQDLIFLNVQKIKYHLLAYFFKQNILKNNTLLFSIQTNSKSKFIKKYSFNYDRTSETDQLIFSSTGLRLSLNSNLQRKITTNKTYNSSPSLLGGEGQARSFIRYEKPTTALLSALTQKAQLILYIPKASFIETILNRKKTRSKTNTEKQTYQLQTNGLLKFVNTESNLKIYKKFYATIKKAKPKKRTKIKNYFYSKTNTLQTMIARWFKEENLDKLVKTEHLITNNQILFYLKEHLLKTNDLSRKDANQGVEKEIDPFPLWGRGERNEIKELSRTNKQNKFGTTRSAPNPLWGTTRIYHRSSPLAALDCSKRVPLGKALIYPYRVRFHSIKESKASNLVQPASQIPICFAHAKPYFKTESLVFEYLKMPKLNLSSTLPVQVKHIESGNKQILKHFKSTFVFPEFFNPISLAKRDSLRSSYGSTRYVCSTRIYYKKMHEQKKLLLTKCVKKMHFVSNSSKKGIITKQLKSGSVFGFSDGLNFKNPQNKPLTRVFDLYPQAGIKAAEQLGQNFFNLTTFDPPSGYSLRSSKIWFATLNQNLAKKLIPYTFYNNFREKRKRVTKTQQSQKLLIYTGSSLSSQNFQLNTRKSEAITKLLNFNKYKIKTYNYLNNQIVKSKTHLASLVQGESNASRQNFHKAVSFGSTRFARSRTSSKFGPGIHHSYMTKFKKWRMRFDNVTVLTQQEQSFKYALKGTAVVKGPHFLKKGMTGTRSPLFPKGTGKEIRKSSLLTKLKATNPLTSYLITRDYTLTANQQHICYIINYYNSLLKSKSFSCNQCEDINQRYVNLFVKFFKSCNIIYTSSFPPIKRHSTQIKSVDTYIHIINRMPINAQNLSKFALLTYFFERAQSPKGEIDTEDRATRDGSLSPFPKRGGGEVANQLTPFSPPSGQLASLVYQKPYVENNKLEKLSFTTLYLFRAKNKYFNSGFKLKSQRLKTENLFNLTLQQDRPLVSLLAFSNKLKVYVSATGMKGESSNNNEFSSTNPPNPFQKSELNKLNKKNFDIEKFKQNLVWVTNKKPRFLPTPKKIEDKTNENKETGNNTKGPQGKYAIFIENPQLASIVPFGNVQRSYDLLAKPIPVVEMKGATMNFLTQKKFVEINFVKVPTSLTIKKIYIVVNTVNFKLSGTKKISNVTVKQNKDLKLLPPISTLFKTFNFESRLNDCNPSHQSARFPPPLGKGTSLRVGNPGLGEFFKHNLQKNVLMSKNRSLKQKNPSKNSMNLPFSTVNNLSPFAPRPFGERESNHLSFNQPSHYVRSSHLTTFNPHPLRGTWSIYNRTFNLDSKTTSSSSYPEGFLTFNNNVIGEISQILHQNYELQLQNYFKMYVTSKLATRFNHTTIVRYTQSSKPKIRLNTSLWYETEVGDNVSLSEPIYNWSYTAIRYVGSKRSKKPFLISKQPCFNIGINSSFNNLSTDVNSSFKVSKKNFNYSSNFALRPFGKDNTYTFKSNSVSDFHYKKNNLILETSYFSPFEGEFLYKKPVRKFVDLNPYENLQQGLLEFSIINSAKNGDSAIKKHQLRKKDIEQKLRIEVFKHYLQYSRRSLSYLKTNNETWSRCNLILTKQDLLTLNYDARVRLVGVKSINNGLVSSGSTTNFARDLLLKTSQQLTNVFMMSMKNGSTKFQTEAYSFDPQGGRPSNSSPVGGLRSFQARPLGESAYLPLQGKVSLNTFIRINKALTGQQRDKSNQSMLSGSNKVLNKFNNNLKNQWIISRCSTLMNTKQTTSFGIYLPNVSFSSETHWHKSTTKFDAEVKRFTNKLLMNIKQKQILTKNKVGFFFLKGAALINSRKTTKTKHRNNSVFENFFKNTRFLNLSLNSEIQKLHLQTNFLDLKPLYDRQMLCNLTSLNRLSRKNFTSFNPLCYFSSSPTLQTEFYRQKYVTLTISSEFFTQATIKTRSTLYLELNLRKEITINNFSQRNVNQSSKARLKTLQIKNVKQNLNNYVKPNIVPFAESSLKFYFPHTVLKKFSNIYDERSEYPLRGTEGEPVDLMTEANVIRLAPRPLGGKVSFAHQSSNVFDTKEIIIIIEHQINLLANFLWEYKSFGKQSQPNILSLPISKPPTHVFHNIIQPYLYLLQKAPKVETASVQTEKKEASFNVIKKSGQLIHMTNKKITIRIGQPLVISPSSIIHATHGDFIESKTKVITLTYQQLKTGDIVQGIPKIEQLFEARTTKRGRLFKDNVTNLLTGLFLNYFVKSTYLLRKNMLDSLLKNTKLVSTQLFDRAKLDTEDPLPSPPSGDNEPSGNAPHHLQGKEIQLNKAKFFPPKGGRPSKIWFATLNPEVRFNSQKLPTSVSLVKSNLSQYLNSKQNQTIILALALQWSVKQSFYKIQQIIVDGILRVYRSQGVSIADKHVEIVVKQMTSKVRIINSNASKMPDYSFSLQFIKQSLDKDDRAKVDKLGKDVKPSRISKLQINSATNGFAKETFKTKIDLPLLKSLKSKRDKLNALNKIYDQNEAKKTQAFENKLLEKLFSNKLDSPTGLFPGEIVDVDFVENINVFLLKTVNLEDTSYRFTSLPLQGKEGVTRYTSPKGSQSFGKLTRSSSNLLNQQSVTTRKLVQPIKYEPIVLGITRASLEVESFLSAASFQQTTRVLSQAALYKKKDFLKGLKENIIIGNLIPAGTGYLSSVNF